MINTDGRQPQMQRIAPFLMLGIFLLAHDTTLAEPHVFSIGDANAIELDIPDAWSSTPQGSDADGGIAIRIVPSDDLPLVLFVTLLTPEEDIPDPMLSMKSIVENTAARLQEVSEEANLALQELNGPYCKGFYVSSTDRTVERPSMDDFKYIDQGLVKLGDLFMTFTVLTNMKDAPERGEALGIVRSARQFGSSLPDQTPALLAISSVRLRPEDLPNNCKFAKGEYAVSMQARTFYGMEDMQTLSGVSIQDRSHQSIKCGRKKGTVYYYQYQTEADVLNALAFLKAFIWGEDHPTPLHSEQFVIMNNVLAVVSSKKPEIFVEMIEASRRK